MSQIRVAVLRGGPCDEYPVSMKTGQSVFNALDRDKYKPIDVVITRSGEWLVDGYTRYPEQVLSTVDVVFNALHGQYGEDGTVQRLMDTNGVRYTGSGAYASSIAMNKAMTKDILHEHGIKMAPHMLVSRDSIPSLHLVADRIADMFGPQFVIKPVNSGSSIGTVIVENPAMLQKRLSESLAVYETVLVEKCIKGVEATCGVVERYRDEAIYRLPPIEIIPPQQAGFFAYEVKYTGETKEICPGNFTRTQSQTLQDVARNVHQELGLRQYSRSDFIVTDDEIYFLEVNTLPGLTEHSLLPKAITAVGSTYPSFLDHLLTDALEHR